VQCVYTVEHQGQNIGGALEVTKGLVVVLNSLAFCMVKIVG